jgi:predicted transcriptional regulator
VDRRDEKLRRESPAYQPAAEWEELEPQALDVVMSLRLDADSAHRLARIATQTGKAPSRLVRDWVVERLPEAERGETRASRVGEARAAYVAAQPDEFEQLRRRYRPTGRVRLLLIGESRPAAGTFFYLANSNLFHATHAAFEGALGPIPDGAAFLDLLRQAGVWLYDLSPAPVNRLRGRPRQDAVAARASELTGLLRTTDPHQVVVVKRSSATVVRHAMQSAELPSERLHVLPFPLYQWRAEYIRALSALVRRGVLGPIGKAG